MSDTSATDRIADSVTEAICRCRLVLAKRGAITEVAEQIDEVAMVGSVFVRVRNVSVYVINIDFSDEVGSVTGRWDEDGLVAAGLADVAQRVAKIREGRSS